MRIMKFAVVLGVLSIAASVVAQDCSVVSGPSGEASHSVYQSVNGIVVIQAEDYAWRKEILCDPVEDHQQWESVNPENPPAGEPTIAGSTGDGYLQLLPDDPLNNPWGGSQVEPFHNQCLRPTVSYFFEVAEEGTYQVYLRWEAHDIASDSVMVGISELADGPGGDHADWYRLGCDGVGDANFETQEWGTPPGFGAAESMTACGNPDAMIWDLEAETVYQLQIIAREGGAAVDAIMIQRVGDDSEPLPSAEELADLEFPVGMEVLEWDPFPCPPPGDECTDAIEIGSGEDREITTAGATLGAVVAGCLEVPAASVHLRHEAEDDEDVLCRLSPPGLGREVTIAAFDDCPSAGGQLIRCEKFVGGGPPPILDVPVPARGVLHFCVGSSGRPAYRGTFTLSQSVGPRFRRGNTNGDAAADISDAVAIFGFLFLGGSEPDCYDSADVNDDGEIDISDGVRLLSHLFLGAPPPSEPGLSACGVDPTEDGLGCAVVPEDCL